MKSLSDMSLRGAAGGETISRDCFVPSRLAMTFLITLSFLVFFSPAAFPAERSLVEALPLSPERSHSGHFEVTITADGKTLPKPGPVFTEDAEEGMALPYLLSAPRPISYPRWAVRQGWEGTFVIAIEVLPTGAVGRWKVMESTGHSLLDEAAIKAVREWRFHPATEQGKAVVSCIQIPVRFKLQD